MTLPRLSMSTTAAYLKVHKNFFGSNLEFCTISFLVMLKYSGFVKKNLIGPLWGEVRLFRVVLRVFKTKWDKKICQAGPIS